MILGLPGPGECFRELDDALVALGRGDVVLNAHVAIDQIPQGATVWHWENEAVDYGDREVWTPFKRQAEETGWKYVPIGYHPSMERFARAPELDIDVIHVGCLNERRQGVLTELAERGLNVVHVQGLHGKQRDALLARAKLCVVPLYYPDGYFNQLRAAHLVANRVPVLFEDAGEAWEGVCRVTHDILVESALAMLDHGFSWPLGPQAVNGGKKLELPS